MMRTSAIWAHFDDLILFYGISEKASSTAIEFLHIFLAYWPSHSSYPRPFMKSRASNHITMYVLSTVLDEIPLDPTKVN